MGRVQVRSERMDEIAEKGMQHITNIKWSYRRKWLDVWLNLLKEALENSESSAVDFVEDFKMNLYSKRSTFYTQRRYITAKRCNIVRLRLSIHSEIGIKLAVSKRETRFELRTTKWRSSRNYYLKSKPTINWLTM
jgi:GTP pyrophosphokinase